LPLLRSPSRRHEVASRKGWQGGEPEGRFIIQPMSASTIFKKTIFYQTQFVIGKYYRYSN